MVTAVFLFLFSAGYGHTANVFFGGWCGSRSLAGMRFQPTTNLSRLPAQLLLSPKLRDSLEGGEISLGSCMSCFRLKQHSCRRSATSLTSKEHACSAYVFLLTFGDERWKVSGRRPNDFTEIHNLIISKLFRLYATDERTRNVYLSTNILRKQNNHQQFCLQI